MKEAFKITNGLAVCSMIEPATGDKNITGIEKNKPGSRSEKTKYCIYGRRDNFIYYPKQKSQIRIPV